MTALLLVVTSVVCGALAVVAFGPAIREAIARRRMARTAVRPEVAWDPGRELRAEKRARELLASVVSDDENAMYRELGFIAVEPHDGEGEPAYGYLIYPHRPIVAYDAASGELLSEYCVSFPDRSEPGLGERLPDSDDVLAKWISLRGGERELIGIANMRVPGWQVDPDQVKRDLMRLRQWRASRREPAAA